MCTRGSCKVHEEKQRKKFIFIIHMRSSCRNKDKNNKIPNEQPTVRCQPAFGSHSHSLTNKLFFSFFFAGLLCASLGHDEKGTFFIIFKCFLSFLTMRTHAQACMVEIHNSLGSKKCSSESVEHFVDILQFTITVQLRLLMIRIPILIRLDVSKGLPETQKRTDYVLIRFVLFQCKMLTFKKLHLH